MKNTSPKYASDKKLSEHILHLYSSKVYKYIIHKSFLGSLKDDEEVIVISSDDPNVIRQELGLWRDRLKVFRPEEMDNLQAEMDGRKRLGIIIDAGSFLSQTERDIGRRERYLHKIAHEYPLRCLCTYKLNGISPEMIRRLSRIHDQLQLTTSDLTMVSGNFMEQLPISYDFVEKNVKDNLESIILTLIQEKAITGLGIMEAINLEFNVLLSPGTVYPLLNSLQRRGLLTSTREGKERRYEPSDESKPEIRRIVFEQILARDLLSSYLQKKIDVGTGTHTLLGLAPAPQRKSDLVRGGEQF